MGSAQTVRAMYDAFESGDIALIWDLLADEVAWNDHHVRTSLEEAGLLCAVRRTGREEVLGFFEEMGKAFHVHSMLPVTILEVGREVVVILDVDLASNRTDSHFEDTIVHFWTCGEDGRITRFLSFADTAKLLQALGMITFAKQARR